MKTLFKKMLAGALLAGLFLNVTSDALAQAWNIPGVGSVSSGGTTGYIGTTGSTDNMIIKTNSAERMRISSAGLVGVGDFSSSTLFSPFQVGTNLKKLSIGNQGSAGYERAYIGFNAGYSGGNWNIYAEPDDGDHGGAVITTESDGSLIFITQGVLGESSNETVSNTTLMNNVRLRIQNPNQEFQILGSGGLGVLGGNATISGTVSIGTISSHPSGYKLFVDDGIITEKIKVATQTWSDFVFDKSYKLMPLTQVEKFIDKNKHLPDVPSEGEMIENGLDVATMDAKLLQKIEELTLYMIEINKKVEVLEKENKELKSKISQQ